MEPSEKKCVRMTLEELDRYGWEPPNLSNLLSCQDGSSIEESCFNVQNMVDTPQIAENAAKSPTVAFWRKVSPLLDALNPAKNA